ncbi:MAG: SBBP repeat-containing protein [Bacteroidetes bacterium]|nr:SBBP repeat-containing protein [Bacteroidota bacterium]
MRKIILFFISICNLIVCNAQAPQLQWVKQLGGSSYDLPGSVAVDASGNVYTVGYFTGSSDFDPGVGTTILTTITYPDCFISKLDAAGNFLWAKQIGGPLPDGGSSITVDVSGNIYITGEFSGTADFDPNAGTYTLTSLGGSDIFILKLDPGGNFLWAKQMDGVLDEYGTTISIDAAGNIYTKGTFQGTVDFDPGVGTYTLAADGSDDVFISKLNSFGNFVWAAQLGGNSYYSGISIAVDALGNVYTTGSFYGIADFDPGPAVFNLTCSINYNDIFISKINSSGNFIWAKQIGGKYFDDGQSLALDAMNNVYITGNFSDTVDFDPGIGITNLIDTTYGSDDIFVLKLNSSGNFIWVRQMGGTSYSEGASIATDVNGNSYTTGNFKGVADFDPSANNFYLTSFGGNSDVFISKLDNAGNFLWAQQLGGNADEFANAITIDPSGDIYSVGVFYGTTDFDPGLSVINLNSFGQGDVYVHKLSQSSVGIVERRFAIDINLYPNPCKDILHFKIRDYDLENKLYNIQIINCNGQLMYEDNLFYNGDQTAFNIGNLPNGIYILNLKDNNSRTISKRFVIAK